MSITKILAPTVVATSAMTIFSYLLSQSTERNFKEPKLLGEIIDKNVPLSSFSESKILGWVAHYLAGMAFITVYDKIWKGLPKNASLKSGLMLGGVSGILGIAVWKLTLHVVPNKPHLPRKKFYLQLLPAHLIFGGFAAKTFQILK